jgi:hypothetical protein
MRIFRLKCLPNEQRLGALFIPSAARSEAADFVFGIDAAPSPGDKHPA